MIESFKKWAIAKMIDLVGDTVADHMAIDGVSVNGTELCEEECEALRAGVVGGLAFASRIAEGNYAGSLTAAATQAYEAAAQTYGLYLKEAEHAED